MKNVLVVFVIGLLALLPISARAGLSFDDQFSGTAADPDSAKWWPNEDSPAFDNYLDTTYSADGALHSECIGGGADNGGHLYFAGPLGKVGIDRTPNGPTVWSWETLYVSPHPDVGNGYNNAFFDVLITPFLPDDKYDNNNNWDHPSKSNLVAVRIGLYDGVVTLIELEDGISQQFYHSYDVDGRAPGVWTLTFPADLTTDPVTVEVDQGSGPVLLHSQALVGGNNIAATEHYPMFRHYNQTGWSPYYIPADTLAVVDWINGVSVPEPVTLALLAVGGLLIRRKK